MATNQTLNLIRRSRKLFSSSTRSIRCLSTSSALTGTSPPPPPPNVMNYDRLAEETETKIKKLENPDSRFLQYNSPHPVVLSDYSRILAAPETKVTTLENGLRIATESNLAAKTATVGVWVDAGSRYECEGTHGTGHFLLHMLFEGTEKRPVRVLEEEIANMGGHFLADCLQNSCFSEDQIVKQRDVILRKMAEGEEEAIFDHLHATAFQYSPLGRTVRGPDANIKAITKKHLESYVMRHCTARRMVIAAAGNVKHEDVVNQVKKHFTKLSTDPTTTAELAELEPAIFTGSEVRIIDDDVPLAHFAVAFSGASWTDPDTIALMVMQSMLGTWSKSAGGGKHMGSVLAQRVGIDVIAENMRAFNINYKDAGLFGVYATCNPDCLDDLGYAIMYEVSKLSYRVSKEDVIRARNQLISSLILNIDGTSPVAEDIGRQLLTYGRRMPVAELIARIDAVDASTVKRVANRFIFDRDIAIAAMGPIRKLPDYNWFRRRTYKNRY
ncbi:hypothetical protein MKW94_025513 [Papaver nudicaule]|uniref:Mitochondrial processing peptidase n=1 Tax=Papaver nudicaule TaxID=74823 RepID=A0AA42AUU5_PAPNU|nr:hypothetical protein [Papaver nudicaule]